jgi:TRAP-type C4-dicarboxylate transport system permease small subunit
MLRRIATSLGALEYRALEITLLLLLLLNGVSVFARYVLHHAVGELFEVMIFLSVASYWLGAATAQRLGGHLGMDFVVMALSPGARRVTDAVRLVVIIGFLGVVVYSGALLVMSQMRFGTSTSLLGWPVWFFSIFLPFGCALLAWRTLFPPRLAGEHHGLLP